MQPINLFAPISESSKKDVLVEFKAGRMNKDSNTKWVRPDARKGLVQLKMNHVDGVVHFIWKDRTTGTTETDLMLFPGDAVFRKVNEANARVYVLEFKTGDKKLFFWMQEQKDEKDKEYCDNINKFINNPPQPNTSNMLGSLGLGEGAAGLAGLNQNQLLQLMAGGRLPRAVAAQQPVTSTPAQSTSTTTTATSTVTPAGTMPAVTTPAASAPVKPSNPQPVNSNAIQLDTLRSFLAGLVVPEKGISLKDVLEPESVINTGVFKSDSVVDSLSEHLPKSNESSTDNLFQNMRSAQYHQAVSMFNQALRSGQMYTVLAMFGLDPSSAGPHSTVEDFLMAIQKKYGQN
eukprot:TRINITY_DN4172_c0_g1_i1.p1 TRINITY_DN4172_c0_g1~~TRINITY_DN4172_c0_g1_i1.p1  ORF type:complete len:346 (-),score=80.37 TRINITY_DN4172_c0_g1_i1:328-1365(-)